MQRTRSGLPGKGVERIDDTEHSVQSWHNCFRKFPKKFDNPPKIEMNCLPKADTIKQASKATNILHLSHNITNCGRNDASSNRKEMLLPIPVNARSSG